MIDKVILGTVQLGILYGLNKSKLTTNESLEILDLAYNSNILTYDTAQDYGNSEQLLATISNISNVQIITKIDFTDILLTPSYILNKQNIKQKINTSLENLELKKLDTLLLHNYEDFKNKILLDILFELCEENIIKNIGISIYTIDEALYVLEDTRIKILQIPFNFLDTQWNNSIFQEKIKKNNVEIHVRSIFLQGILLSTYDKWPILNKETKKIYDTINKLCNIFQLSKIEFCIKYVNSISFINKIIFGIDNLHQLKFNIMIFNNITQFTTKELYYINSKFNNIPENLINPSLW